MTPEIKEELLRCLMIGRGDDLERLELMCRGRDLDLPFYSGRLDTGRQLLGRYREQRRLWQAAYDYVKGVAV